MAIEWEREAVIKELVDEFGEEYRDEIEETLSLTEGEWADYGDSGSVEIDGERYTLIRDEDEAERIAIEVVKEDLRNEPELFDKNWLSNFIYITETDKNMILADEESFLREDAEYEAEQEFEDKYLELDEIEDEEERIKREEELDTEKERWIEEYIKERLEDIERGLEDPINYFVYEEGLYTLEELLKLPWIQIDIDEASRDAIRTDGWEHFLSRYDGTYNTTKNGLVYFIEG
jgi:hypothetical protein